MDVATLVWMLVILKIPIIAALLLIWYAVREPDQSSDEDDGGSRVPREPTPRPDRPRRPRRGPHGDPRPRPQEGAGGQGAAAQATRWALGSLGSAA